MTSRRRAPRATLSGLSALALAALGVLVAAACTRTSEPRAVRPEPPVVARADAAPPVELAPPDAAGAVAPRAARDEPSPEEPTSAWTDARAVAELAKDCRWDPPHGEYEESPLSCKSALFEQSCVVDPCHDVDQQTCKPKCLKTCEGCAEECTTSCETCKASCKDGACREACAQRCGACRQACIQAKDRCATGTCGKAYDACTAALEKRWRASKCPGACVKLEACREACESQACFEGCDRKVFAGCPKDLRALCFNGPNPFGDPTSDAAP